MSALLTCNGVGYTAGTKLLFEDLSMAVDSRDRVGLTGHNGAGKSTLLRLLAGQLSPDSGVISGSRGLHVELVEQFLPESLAGVALLDAVLERLPLETRSSDTWRAELALAQMRFGARELAQPVGQLSGGQQNRLMLARALVGEPQLLLLDEPTNHLDIATVHMLQTFLRDELPAALVLVSHDRELLDSVTARTVVLRDHRAYSYAMPFSRARGELLQADIAAAQRHRVEQQRIDKLRVAAKRVLIWGREHDNEKLVKRARNMEKRVARMEDARTFVSRGSGLALNVSTSDTRTARMLRLADLDVRPPGVTAGPPLYQIDELVLRTGERAVLLGANGCGKSSLIRRLVDHCRTCRDDTRHIAFSPQATLGYYDQELDELAADVSIVEYLRAQSDAGETVIRNTLIHAGFAYADHTRAINVLSGGERARVLFVKLELARPNLLILDEPTNHIDIDGREALESQLLEGSATVLMTSHDRRFIEEVADRFLMIDGGQLREIYDPDEFYAGLTTPAASAGGQRAMAGGSTDSHADESTGSHTDAHTDRSGTRVPAVDAAEQLLTRLVELEELLAADRARKPKFQKPALQAQWRAEIEALSARL